MNSLRRIVLLLGLAAAAVLPVRTVAAPPAPGTIIRNQADLSYVDPTVFTVRAMISNEVQAVVPGGAGLDLQADRSVLVTPGSWFSLPHRLTNPGNATGSYTLTPSQVPGGDFTASNLALVLDHNGNGIVDAGEPQFPFPQAYAATLPPGGELRVILIGHVDAGAVAGSLSVRLQADLASPALTAANTDTVTIGTGELQFFKSVSTPTAVAGDEVDYTLSGTNNYPVALGQTLVSIDGAITDGVIVRDVLPDDLSFVSFVSSGPATPLYHELGAGHHVYTTTLPSGGLARVDAVAFSFPMLAAGDSFSVSFRVKVGDSASGVIPNTAHIHAMYGALPLVTESNTATLTVPVRRPTIGYYDSGFTREVLATGAGSHLYVGIEAGSCSTLPYPPDPVRRMITVVIISKDTGDEATFTAIESDPDSGFYVINTHPSVLTTYDPAFDFVPTQNAATAIVDGIIQTVRNDVLTARIEDCGGIEVSTRILIDPYGIVYDSRTGDPLAGVRVELQRETSPDVFENATTGVYDMAANPIDYFQTTNNAGEFNYPAVDPGVYRLVVIPPADYAFPSVRPVGSQLALGRDILDGSFTGGSYGGAFSVILDPVKFDVPLDPTTATNFTLEKEGSRDVAEIGDSVIYTLTLTNNSGADYAYTFIDDRLPTGFRYEPGTTRRDGVPVADPQGGVGPSLRFPVGTLADGGKTVFTYRVRLTPGAEKGKGVNTAQAISYGPPALTSNRATHTVKVEQGVFDPRGIIIGTVFVDANGNDIQDAGEPGVPGVRLVLEDGTYAITDGAGQYSIYGQRPITHALKLDPHTLPPGAKLGGNSPRFALDPNSRFVDLKNHELHKANFLVVEPTPALYAAIEERRKQAAAGKSEVQGALDIVFQADGARTLITDPMNRPAAGIVGANGGIAAPAFSPILPAGTRTSGNSGLPPSPVAVVPLIDLEKLVATLTDTETDFIGLKDGDTLPSAQATVRIKGHAESALALFVNGKPAPDSRIGKKVRQAHPPLQAVEYIALPLVPGPNVLEIVQSDFFGNERARKQITVVAPDTLARFDLSFSNATPFADGRTPVEVTVTAVDAHDVPVTASMPLTLETTLGRWDVQDVNPREPGIQVVFQNGKGVYPLVAPVEPGDARLVVSSGTMKVEERLAFLPELRPMIATGIIEGRFAFNRLSSNQLLSTDPSDGFEDELRTSAGIGADGMGTGRAAFYLKGKISGETLLTIAYDSDKKRGDVELFRDIDPDAYYPVYGDSSVKGYDAQSTGKLYVRIDHGRSYALLGDFNTRADGEVRELGDYNRSLNGVRLEHQNARFKGGLWASDDSTEQDIREIPANGTSGPFSLSGNGLLGSETVEILVRDRNQRSVILSRTKLTRNVDYEFEPFSGNLLLRRPLPSVDANFNPQSLRITYEIETGGPRFWVYGGDAQFKVHDRIEIGGSFARDENPVEPYDLQSANATVELFKGTYLIAEAARSETLAQGEGFARRVDIRHKSAGTEARIFYGETDESFDNPSSTLNAGRAEGGAKITRQLAPRTQLIGEAVYTKDLAGSGNREGVRVDVAHTLPSQVKLTVGVRASEETSTAANPVAPAPGAGDPTPTPITVRSVRVRVDTPVPYHPQATVFGEYEQDVLEEDQRIVAAGGNYQVGTRTRLYARHEFISTLGGPFELNSTQQNNRTIAGVETEYLKDASFFNEYRVQNAIDGPLSEASTGLRNGWQVGDGLRLNTTFERITPFDGVTTNESTSITAAVDYTGAEDWKATARVEGRWADTSTTYLNTLGYARKLTDEWTFLGRSIVNLQFNDTPDTADLFQGRLLTGLAWRQDPEDVWNALFRYEYKYEQGSTTLGATDMRRHVHIFASSVNYQPDDQWIFSGHWATKWVRESYDDDPSGNYAAHLLAGRVLFELSPRWDVGLNLAATFSDSLQNVQYAVGPEIGYILKKNVRIGVGYNLRGFSDRDFDTAATSQGLFLSLRIKFDENLLKWARFDRQEANP